MAIIRLTNRYIKDGKVVGYKGIYLCDIWDTRFPKEAQTVIKKGDKISMLIDTTWQFAKQGSIENVIAYGDVTIPKPCPIDGTYNFTALEISKMRLRGINGFKISSLPAIPSWF